MQAPSPQCYKAVLQKLMVMEFPFSDGSFVTGVPAEDFNASAEAKGYIGNSVIYSRSVACWEICCADLPTVQKKKMVEKERSKRDWHYSRLHISSDFFFLFLCC